MIPTKKEIIVEDTLGGEKVAMTIDPTAFQHMMALVTDLYSDKEMAVIREYSCNALDEHIQAGVPLPIEVTTPTQLFPFLRIRDYGKGLDKDGIVNIYSRYGASTKRENNDVTGYLGVGCKSALSYTNQFTVVGIKEGIKTTVSVSRDEKGVGSMTIVDESPTDESSGTEILIPAKASNTFEHRATFLFKFWPEGTVVLNGKEPERWEGMSVTDDILMIKGGLNLAGYKLSHYLVMGNVPYPIDASHCDFKLPTSFALIIKVPNGSIEFAPSREGLMYSRVTLEVLEQAKENVQTGLAKAISKEINQAPNCHSALTVALEWRASMGEAARSITLRWRNHELPESIMMAQDGERFIISKGSVETDYYGKNVKVGKHSYLPSVELKVVSDSIWVYGFDRSFTPVVKKKLWKFCDDLGWDKPTNFIMCRDKPQSPWIDPDKVVPWAPIDALKLPRATADGRTLVGNRIPGSYDLYMCSGGGPVRMEDVPGDDIDTSMTVYYIVSKDHYAALHAAKQLAQVDDDFTLVYFASNREAKFCRLFPQAKKYQAAMRELATEWLEMLSEREIVWLRMHHRCTSNLNRTLGDIRKLPRFGVFDPELQSARAILDGQGPVHKSELDNQFDVFAQFVNLPLWPHPMDKYPLYRDYVSYHVGDRTLRQHNILYLNAAYQAALTTGGNDNA